MGWQSPDGGVTDKSQLARIFHRGIVGAGFSIPEQEGAIMDCSQRLMRTPPPFPQAIFASDQRCTELSIGYGLNAGDEPDVARRAATVRMRSCQG